MEKFSMDCQNLGMGRIQNHLLPAVSRPDQVGLRVSALRETLGLSKSALADAIGLDRSSMTKVEKGQAGLDINMAINISTLYGFGLDFIYRGDLSDVPLQYRPTLVQNLRIAEDQR